MSLSEQLVKVIIESISKNPSSKAEAIALVAYIIQRDVLPLVEQLKDYAVGELEKAEQCIAKSAMAELRVLEQYVTKQVENVVSGRCCTRVKKVDSVIPPQ